MLSTKLNKLLFKVKKLFYQSLAINLLKLQEKIMNNLDIMKIVELILEIKPKFTDE